MHEHVALVMRLEKAFGRAAVDAQLHRREIGVDVRLQQPPRAFLIR
jgi:hypothetical protein